MSNLSAANITLRLFPFYILLCSCSSDSSNGDDSSSPNLPPSDFEITILDTSYIETHIEWSQSFDPEEGAIVYSVSLDNVILAQELSSRTYTFDNLEASETYEITIIASDIEENEKAISTTLLTTGNSAPLDFDLIALNTTNVSASLLWEEAIDPEEDTIVYDVLLDDESIVTDYESTTFNIYNLEPNRTYECKVIARDSLGNTNVLLFDITTNDGVFDGDIDFSSQESVIQFGEEGWIEINGSLTIGSPGTTSTVNDLTPLFKLKKIQQSVTFWDADGLITTAGFSPESIGGTFRIESNDDLTTIPDFPLLKRITDNLIIKSNSSLININSFSTVETIGGNLLIENNFILNSITGFDALTTVSSIRVRLHSELADLNGFNSLVSLENTLVVGSSPILSTLNAFNSLEAAGGITFENLGIENLNFLNQLRTARVQLFVANCPYLENIDGLANFESVTFGTFGLAENPLIQNLDALANLIEVASSLSIRENAQLSDFCGLQNLFSTNPSFEVTIYDNLFNPTEQDIINGNCSN